MTTQEILQKVALRELTPERAAEIMLEPELPAWPSSALWLLALAVLAAVGLFWPGVGHSQAPRYTAADALDGSRACVSEATWLGGSSPECGGIIQVVESRRHEGESFRSALHRTMPRFFGGRTDRLWALRLEFGPIRQNPEGWPYTYGAAHHSHDWHEVYERVTEYMNGTRPLPCSPQPSSWLGRETDGHVLADRLASGWREVDCGGPTVNAFIAR